MIFDVSHSQTHPFWMYKLEVSKKRVVPTNIWIRDDWSLKFWGVLPPHMLDWGPQCMANCLTGKQTNEVLILWKWGWPFPGSNLNLRHVLFETRVPTITHCLIIIIPVQTQIWCYHGVYLLLSSDLNRDKHLSLSGGILHVQTHHLLNGKSLKCSLVSKQARHALARDTYKEQDLLGNKQNKMYNNPRTAPPRYLHLSSKLYYI